MQRPLSETGGCNGSIWRSFQAKSGQDSPCDRGINGIRGFAILCVTGMRRDSAMMAREEAAALESRPENAFFGGFMIDKSFHSAGITFPARLILGGDQFFEVMRYNQELYRLAYRQARKQAVAEGLVSRCVWSSKAIARTLHELIRHS